MSDVSRFTTFCIDVWKFDSAANFVIANQQEIRKVIGKYIFRCGKHQFKLYLGIPYPGSK
jgi:hypothetical protein